VEISLIALIIGIVLIITLLIGVPIAFGLMGLSAGLLFVFCGQDVLFLVVAATLKQMTTGIFIAVPLFVLMAAILQFSGVVRDLYDSIYLWMGPLRGGLAIGTVIISTVLAAVSGVAATATTVMGLMALPEMNKRGYSKQMSLGSITAGGALGALIPPSVLMIIIGGFSGVSVGKLFIGGIIPGLLVSLCWIIYIVVRCFIRKEDGPALPLEQRGTFREKVISLKSFILPFFLVVVVLGVIYGGVCTPTEAASFGVFGALICAAVNRKLNWTNMKQALFTTVRINAMIMWLVVGGGCYSALISVTGVRVLITNILTGLPFGPLGVMLIILLVVLIMGMFIDPVAITMICVPVIVPTIKLLHVDLLWMTLMFTMCVILGFITPPFGLNLFYMKGVAPRGTSMMQIYQGVIPYCLLMLAVVVLCFMFPSILVWLPNAVIT